MDHDVIIVGAGFAGANLALDLATKGHTVLVIEAGPGLTVSRDKLMENFWLSYPSTPNTPYPPDGLASANIPLAPETTNAGRAAIMDLAITTDHNKTREERNRQTYLTYDETSARDYTESPFASSYERIVGGTGNHWSGTCLRMGDTDFRTQSNHGVGRDWPAAIDAESLADDYASAESRIGVCANASEQRDATDAYFPEGYEYPMPALELSMVDQRIAKAADGQALTEDNPQAAKVSNTPAGRNSIPYDGRRTCHGNTNCTPMCPIQAKYDPTVTLARALQTGRVELWPKTVVDRVNVDSSGRVSSVHYLKYEDTSVPAKSAATSSGETGTTDTIFVLAANAIENAKMLLASPWKNGTTVANTSDMVGRNLMDHPSFLVWGLTAAQETPVYSFRGPLTTSGIENLRDGAFRATRARGESRSETRDGCGRSATRC